MENKPKMLEDHTGKKSPKRIMGVLLIIVCIIMSYIEQIFGKPINNIVFSSFMISGTALLGITVAEKLKNILK